MASLELESAIGINLSSPSCVHLLNRNDNGEELIFYPVSNYGIVYNLDTKEQIFLSQHSDVITSSALSADKQFLILGDSASCGSSKLTVWYADMYELAASYSLPSGFGVQTLAISSNNTLTAAIINEAVPPSSSSNNNEKQKIRQHLILFTLAPKNEEQSLPLQLQVLYQQELECRSDEPSLYHFIAFNHDSSELITHGADVANFVFWKICKSAESEKQQNNCNNDANDENEVVPVPYYVQPLVDNINNLDLANIGQLTQSAFLPLNDSPLFTGTENGDLIVWNFVDKKSAASSSAHRVIEKIVNKVIRGAINCVCALPNNNIIVLASGAGNVRFYDRQCRVVGWLDYLGDAVVSVSFPAQVPSYGDICSVKEDPFVVPDMIIGTKKHKIIKIDSPNQMESSRPQTSHFKTETQNKKENAAVEVQRETVLDTFNAVCTAMSAHSVLPLVAIGTDVGQIQIWNIAQKRMVQAINLAHTPNITDMKFSPNGEWLAFAADSYLRIYDAATFSELQYFKTGYDGVVKNVCFSDCNEWLALSQADRMSVYRFWYNINDLKKQKPKEWVLIGNYVAHKQSIVDVHFAEPSGLDTVPQRRVPRLFSVGCDRLINEYNLLRSSPNFGLRIKYTFQLTLSSTPTLIQFMPGLKVNTAADSDNQQNEEETGIAPQYNAQTKEWQYIEDALIVFDDELKMHFYAAPRLSLPQTSPRAHATPHERTKETVTDGKDGDEKQENEFEPLRFRRTVSGPCYGAPVQKVIRMMNGKNFLYAASDSVIGLMEAPFNGNPYRYVDCNAHPSQIGGFEWVLNVTSDEDDGCRLITNGGYDKCLLVWKVNAARLSQQILDCDEEQKLPQIYRQFLSQEKENGKETDLYQEMKDYFYYVQIENQGVLSTAPRTIAGKISLKQVKSIFQAMGCFLTQSDVDRIQKEIIHRFGYNMQTTNVVSIDFEQFIELFWNYRSHLQLSLRSLQAAFDNVFKNEANKENTKDQFMQILQKSGDKMSKEELMNCLQSLTGYKQADLLRLLPRHVDTAFFIKYILGFTPQTEN